MNFDMTFCHANCCPRKDRCSRYWSEDVAREAERLGIRYHSAFVGMTPNSERCEYFLEKEDEEN